MNSKVNTVLVTGGAGFIGSHVTDELIKHGHSVIVLDDLSGGFTDNVNPKAKFIKGSVADTILVDKIFSENRISHIFHLAAYAAEGLSHFIRHFNYENNVLGSINLINAAIRHNIECFVFTSSIAVYGAGQVPMREDMIPQPEDPYGIAKYTIELDLKAANRMFGLNYVILRPHNVYGERQNTGDKYRNVIGIFMNQLMQNQPLTIFGDGNQQRAFSYVGDIAPIIVKAGFNETAYGQTFNIGADQPYTVNELAKAIGQAMDKPLHVEHLPARNEVVEAYSDHTKVKNMLGYKTTVSLAEGIKKMAQWAKSVGPRQSEKFKNIEITKNLPPSWIS